MLFLMWVQGFISSHHSKLIILQYKDPDVIEKLKEATGDGIHLALDAISIHETHAFTVRVLALGVKGRVVTLSPTTDQVKAMRKDVEIICTFVPTPAPTFPLLTRTALFVDTIIYTAFGVKEGNLFPDDGERENLSSFIYDKLPGLVRERKIKPNVITEWEGGLERAPDAIEHLAAGKVSGEKIVLSL